LAADSFPDDRADSSPDTHADAADDNADTAADDATATAHDDGPGADDSLPDDTAAGCLNRLRATGVGTRVGSFGRKLHEQVVMGWH
jgi:hypothetical protein